MSRALQHMLPSSFVAGSASLHRVMQGGGMVRTMYTQLCAPKQIEVLRAMKTQT